MTPKKIALWLVPPLAFGLGFAVRLVSAPSPADSTAKDAPAGGDRAGRPAGDEPAAPAQQPAGKAAPPRGGEQPAAAQEGRGQAQDPPQPKLGQFELTIVDAGSGQAPPDSHFRVVPSKGGGMVQQLTAWSQLASASPTDTALFGEAGLPLPADGKVQLRVPIGIEFHLELSRAGGPFVGPFPLGTLGAQDRRRTLTLDVARLGGAPAAAPATPVAGAAAADAPAPRETPRAALPPEDLQPFHGFVVAAESGEAVAGAKVVERGRTLASSDEEGIFSLPYDPMVAPAYRVAGPGLGPTIVQLRPGHETPEEALVIRLRPSASISARILDPAGRPVPDIFVSIAVDLAHVLGEEAGFEPGAAPDEIGNLTWNAGTNHLGMVFFDGLPAGVPLHIRARRTSGQRPDGSVSPGLAGIPREVVLAPGEKLSTEWTLPRRPELRGLVADQEGRPVAGVPVWLVRAEGGAGTRARYLSREDQPAAVCASAADGSFHFKDIEPGVWLVGAGFAEGAEERAIELAVDHRAQPVEVPKPGGPELGELVLRVGRGLALRGVVLDPEGRPAAGLQVTAIEEGGLGTAGTRSAEDGRFTLGPLSRGSFRLFVNGHPDAGLQRYGPVLAGAQDLVLRIARTIPLEGRVSAADGSPRAAVVGVFQGGVLRAELRTREPEKPGFFRAGDLDPGVYDFVATTEDGFVGAARDVAFGPGEPDGGVRIQLAQGGLVTVLYQGGEPWRHLTILHEGRTVALGLVHRSIPSARFVPAGRVTVRLQGSEGEIHERSIEIRRSETIELSFGVTPDVKPPVAEPPPEMPFDEPVPEDDEGEGEGEFDGEAPPRIQDADGAAEAVKGAATGSRA